MEPADEAGDGRALAEDIRSHLRAHVVYQHASDADALTLWLMGAWAMGVWRLWPKVLITAPERACGKSTLLEVMGAFAPRTLLASSATPAVLFRAMDLWSPALLLDEIDTWAMENAELRGIINSGHTRVTAHVLRCDGDDNAPRRFSTWGPMVLSGIGKPADTIVSRSLVVSLRRKLPDEITRRLSPDIYVGMRETRRRMMRWAKDHAAVLAASQADAPPCGDDRRRDNFGPLYRIAAALGGPWPDRIGAAYALAQDDDAEPSAGVMLLRDLMEKFERDRAERLTTTDIITDLISDDEKPWGDWRHGKPATARTLSRLLTPYGVKPRNLKLPGGKVAKGYARSDIEEAHARYAVLSATPLPL